MDLPLQYDVTFVGQPHGERRKWIGALTESGINVQAWGSGWDSGRLTQSQMMEVFSTSRINLNLANASSSGVPRPSNGIKNRLYRKGAAILPSKMKDTLKAFGLRRPQPTVVVSSAPCLPEQIKGRNFEVPGCGGFILTGGAEDLESYYENGKEIVCFDSIPELIEKIRYYLSNETERVRIAEAGYRRTLSQHTYVHRFAEIFKAMGLPTPDPAKIISQPPAPGEASDVIR
jgi:spore maturation protein CgeB